MNTFLWASESLWEYVLFFLSHKNQNIQKATKSRIGVKFLGTAIYTNWKKALANHWGCLDHLWTTPNLLLKNQNGT